MVLLLVFPDVALLALRLYLGIVMMVHGYPKLFKNEARNQALGWMKSMGISPALAILAALIEFLGGLGLVVGLLTQFAALFIFLEMIGTTILHRVKMGHKFIGGYELDVSYLAMAFALFLSGPGALALDRLLRFG